MKLEKFVKWYNFALAIISLCLGVAGVAVVWTCYFTGKGDAMIYSPERMKTLFGPFGIAALVFLALLIAGIVLNIICKYKQPTPIQDRTNHRLELAKAKYRPLTKEEKEAYKPIFIKARICLGIYLGIVAVCAFFIIFFSFTAKIDTTKVSESAINIFAHIGPFMLLALIATGALILLTDKLKKDFIEKAFKEKTKLEKAKLNYKRLWIIRGVVALVLVAFLVVGIVGGGFDDVLAKAAAICTECIGIG